MHGLQPQDCLHWQLHKSPATVGARGGAALGKSSVPLCGFVLSYTRHAEKTLSPP